MLENVRNNRLTYLISHIIYLNDIDNSLVIQIYIAGQITKQNLSLSSQRKTCKDAALVHA